MAFLERWRREILKKSWERLILYSVTGMTMVLLDEYIKEGYWFNVIEIVTLELTHEKLFVGLLAILGFSVFKKLTRTRKDVH